MRQLLVVAAVLLVSAPVTIAAEGGAKPDPAQMQAMMEQMGKTGPEHEQLKKAIGEWSVEESAYMDPSQPPMKTQYKATFSEALGGKWVKQELTGEFMGKPYTGLGYSGYDTLAKQYVVTWMDTMSTVGMMMKGKASADGKTITYEGRMEHCPMTSGPMDTRAVLTMESADRMTFSMSGIMDGKPVKMFDSVYTRAGKK